MCLSVSLAWSNTNNSNHKQVHFKILSCLFQPFDVLCFHVDMARLLFSLVTSAIFVASWPQSTSLRLAPAVTLIARSLTLPCRWADWRLLECGQVVGGSVADVWRCDDQKKLFCVILCLSNMADVVGCSHLFISWFGFWTNNESIQLLVVYGIFDATHLASLSSMWVSLPDTYAICPLQVIKRLTSAVSCSHKEAVEFATTVDREGRSCVYSGPLATCQKCCSAIQVHTRLSAVLWQSVAVLCNWPSVRRNNGRHSWVWKLLFQLKRRV